MGWTVRDSSAAPQPAELTKSCSISKLGAYNTQLWVFYDIFLALVEQWREVKRGQMQGEMVGSEQHVHQSAVTTKSSCDYQVNRSHRVTISVTPKSWV